jgi:folate-binding protein YgfZ
MTDALQTDFHLEGAVRLVHTGLIRARGADAAAFLHGQLTNDFTGLGLNEARLAALCSAKGRMLASFVGLRRGEDEFWLACRADLLAATLKRLRMFVLRAKVQLDEPGESLALLGLSGAAAADRLRAAGVDAASLAVWTHRRLESGISVVRLPDAAGRSRWLCALPAEAATGLLDQLPALSLAAWDWLEVQSGVAPVQAATIEAFVPQMLNYELVGGVNFQKGCYPGQEVVARSQYRGTLKRRALPVHGDVAMLAGQEVFWSGDAGQPSGVVAAAAPAPGGGHDALVELKLAALEGGSLHLGAADGPTLKLGVLPYALPASAAPAPRETAAPG